MTKCVRCGKCCKGCRFLMRLQSGKTFCRIYPNRIGTIVSDKLVCVPRKEQFDENGNIEHFEGCPFG